MSKRVYGIDLGTTYSCIAYVDEHGKPVVVPNSQNEQTTPSVVYYQSPDTVVVGQDAKENAKVHSDLVVSTIKRSMGDPNYQREIHGNTYRPAEIASQILRRLVGDASTLTGDKIEDVVITCPAYFGIAEREATRQAGIIAGLNPVYIIPEPTAAAVAYGIEDARPQNILVYDLGGGTFDITLISITPGEIAVIATGGDHRLGGKDWDEALVNYLAKSFEQVTGTSADQLLADMETYQELLNDAEKLKVSLSQARATTRKVRFQAGEAKVEVTRDKFEELTRDLLDRTISMTKEMLATGEKRGVKRIDKMLLVGGSTYMPQVINRVKQEFAFEVVQFDPNMAVAKGAAIFGRRCELIEKLKERVAEATSRPVTQVDIGSVPPEVLEPIKRELAGTEGISLGGLKGLTDKQISNVTAKSFGLRVWDETKGHDVVQNLVVVNSKVPAERTQRFPTKDAGQTEVDLEVWENQMSEEEVQLSSCASEPTGSAVLRFQRALPKGSLVAITFKLAPDGCLSLFGKDLTTGAEVHADFKTGSVLTNDELEKARSRALATSVVAG